MILTVATLGGGGHANASSIAVEGGTVADSLEQVVVPVGPAETVGALEQAK